MPNKAAKVKKQNRHKISEDLKVNGRTAKQRARNIKKNLRRIANRST